jgi:hypothetical protein
VKTLLYERKYTIEGARQRLSELRKDSSQLEVELGETKLKDTFEEMAEHLGSLVDYIERFRRGEAEPGDVER